MESSTVSTPGNPASSAGTGHPVGFWFFFWGEFAERCSYYGMRAILAMYMIDKLGVDKGNAGTYMSLFIAACYFFPLIGGWVADNFLGKYWTIVLFSVPYVVAQFIVGIENPIIVMGALVLLAMGSGVIKPNISTLMGLTYDQQRPGQSQLRSSAFSWFYMAINIGAFLSQSTMPWLRDKYDYQIAFMFPAGLMALALVIFALGKRFYGQETIVQLVTTPPADGETGYKTITGVPIVKQYVTPEEKQNRRALRLQTLQRIGLLFLTVMFFWAIFDQSASTWIFFANTYMDCTLFGVPVPPDAIQAFNALFIIAMVPLSVVIFKAFPIKATNKIALGFGFTALSMAIMSFSGFMAGASQKGTKLTFSDGYVVLPASTEALDKVTDTLTMGGASLSGVTSNYDNAKKKLTIKAGELAIADKPTMPLANSVASLTDLVDGTNVLEVVKSGEAKAGEIAIVADVVDWVKPAERVTVWWQVLAYLILTAGEVLVSITGLELAFVAAPASMKSFVTACWLAVVFLANLLINAPITQLYPLMPPTFYFGLLGVAMAAILLVYFPIAARFNAGLEAGANA
ncbi:oligopeptide:H+ symporter [Pirellulaceae bacterium SH449]